MRVGDNRKPYREVRRLILDGDVAIWHGRTRKPLHLAIQDSTASGYIHVAKLGWCYPADSNNGEGRLLIHEFTMKKGGSSSIFSSQLRGESGNWSIFRPDFHTKKQRWQSVLHMIDITGQPYDRPTLWSNLLRAIPGLRWLFGRQHVDEDDQSTWGYRVCSASVVRADRLVGLNPETGESTTDPVPHRADWRCTPLDVVCSRFYKYLWTLVD